MDVGEADPADALRLQGRRAVVIYLKRRVVLELDGGVCNGKGRSIRKIEEPGQARSGCGMLGAEQDLRGGEGERRGLGEACHQEVAGADLPGGFHRAVVTGQRGRGQGEGDRAGGVGGENVRLRRTRAAGGDFGEGVGRG